MPGMGRGFRKMPNNWPRPDLSNHRPCGGGALPRLDAAELRHYALVQGSRVRSGEKDFAAHGNLRQC
jgi:hypothetical protein